MDRSAIERLLRRWTKDAITDRRLETFDDLLAEDVVDRTTTPPSRGVAAFKARAGAVYAAFSEIDVSVDDLIVDGDALAWRWTLTGTHVGPFAGVAPTGRRVTLRGVNFQRVAGERVIEHWTLADVHGAIQALRQ
jgi:steroid delta-isomerase-like uncharacterized protein